MWWPPDRLNCLLLIEAATVSRLRMQWSNWSVPSLLVRNQVILICCIACGSRPYRESRRDNMRVSRYAYGTCARTDAPNALTPHSACTLQWLPEGKLGEVTKWSGGALAWASMAGALTVLLEKTTLAPGRSSARRCPGRDVHPCPFHKTSATRGRSHCKPSLMLDF